MRQFWFYYFQRFFRWVTSTCPLDYSTVAVADKFGNLSVVRLPSNTNDDIDEDPTGEKGY